MRSKEVGRSLAAFLLSFAMLLSIVFVVVGVQRTINADSNPPTGIHLTWNENENNTAYSIVVTWETSTDTSGDNVLYDNQSGGGFPGNYRNSAVGSHHNYTGSGGYIHDVELTGLSPNTVYFFICGGENGGWSAELKFKTAPDLRTSKLTFVAGGDSRSDSSTSGVWPGLSRDSVSRAMAKFNPSFVLFVGDIIHYADWDNEWDNWFAAEQMYWVDNDNLSIPIIPCIGNHEKLNYPNHSDPANVISYLGQFSLPGNEKWYSLNWGPNLHIIVLDDETTTITGVDEQTNWLKQDLAAHANYMWKIVLFHEPVYRDNGVKRDDESNYWAPLFDQYHVDLVVSGHTHVYERTYPIKGNLVKSSPEDGTVYIVSGGWGAPIYTDVTSGKYSAYGPAFVYNFVAIDISDNGTHQTLQLKAVDNNGNIFDNLTIDKICKPIVSISPSENHADNGQTVTFNVTVTNTENFLHNYVLKASDSAVPTWGPSLSENSLIIQANGENTVILSVPVPPDAIGGTSDNVTVTAALQTDNTVSGSGICTARASILRYVQVTISPSPQQGSTGDNLIYTIVVKNTGAVADNYKLTLSENLGWIHGWNAPSQVTLYQPLSSNLLPTDDTFVQENWTYTLGPAGHNYNMYVGYDVKYDSKTEWSYVKFNISSIPSGRRIDNAYLYLNTDHGPSNTVYYGGPFIADNQWVEAWTVAGGVDNDNWHEWGVGDNVLWDHRPNGPSGYYGDLLDNVYVIAENWAGGTNKWYSWNVTPLVQSDYTGDQLVSILLRSSNEDNLHLDNSTVWFYTKDNDWHGGGPYKPYLQVNYSENIGILENSVSLGPGENWTGQLWVVVEWAPGTTDNLAVAATSLIDNTVTTSAIGQAQSVLYPFDVGVSISPSENHAENGQTVTFIVTVKNMGSNTDNYDLTVIDNDNWGPTLDNYGFENILSGENRTTTLRVKIPDNATLGTYDNITVTATSHGDPEVEKDASCVASYVVVNSLDLVAGWNLVGFTAVGANDTPTNLFPGLTYLDNFRLIYWQAPGGPYKTQPSGLVLIDNTGYWVWIDQDYTVTTSGTRPASRTENMKAGWNMVCFPVTNASTTPHNLFPDLTYLDNFRLIYWQAPGGPYRTQPETGVLMDNRGYWVWINRNYTVTVP